MQKLDRRSFVVGALSAGAWASSISGAAQAAQVESLGELAAEKGILFGSMIKMRLLNQDDRYNAMMREQCKLFTCPLMHWDLLAKKQGEYDFSRPDGDQAWAEANGMQFRGHAMIWSDHIPKWFGRLKDRASAEKAIRDHVHTLGTRYAGKMQSWDVVNEAIKPNVGRPDGLDESVLTKQIGPEFLDIAFQAAREADPKAELVYNDGSNTYDIPDQELRRKALLGVVDRFKKNNVPIDCVGLHAHLLTEYNPQFNDKLLENFLQEISSRGVKIVIAELDVGDKGSPADVKVRDAEVAALYKRFLDIALANPAVHQVITWGLTDRDSWVVRGDMKVFKRNDDATPRPLPFDRRYRPKPAFYAIADAFKAAPKR